MVQEFRTSWLGSELKVSCYEESLTESLRWIAEDFPFGDELPVQQKVHIEIRSSQEQPQNTHKGFPLFRTRMCQTIGILRRICVYDEKHCVVLSTAQDATVFGSDPQFTSEILYSLIMSLWGESFERLGFLRLHASAWEQNGRAQVLWGPSGLGKSKWTWDLLQNKNLVFGDEMVLFDGERIFPFPMRLALKEDMLPPGVPHRKFQRKIFDEKFLLTIPQELIASSKPIGDFYHQGHQLSLLLSLVFGLGLTQMSEFFLRGNNIPLLFKLLIQRTYRYSQLLPHFKPRSSLPKLLP
ncbi:MAG: hypothetical protein ACK5P6_03550 [Pseudobdellovibrionaceae bacterium]